MELERETGWKLHPIGGDTGHAYMGVKDEEKLFLKRNSSPFLAALSLEGISPKLIWTKRIGNGDILTAQEWCNGRHLQKNEMNSTRVIHLLQKVHHSNSLKRMLKRLDGRRVTPSDLIASYTSELPNELAQDPNLKEKLNWLTETKQEVINDSSVTVCHGDMSRENWMLSEEGKLYLVDWDSVILADPAYDVGQLFNRYFDQADWMSGLKKYELEGTKNFTKRMYWYAIMTLLSDIKKNYKKGQFHKVNKKIEKVHDWEVLSETIK